MREKSNEGKKYWGCLKRNLSYVRISANDCRKRIEELMKNADQYTGFAAGSGNFAK